MPPSRSGIDKQQPRPSGEHSRQPSGGSGSKRPKTSQACAACKRHKTRCERLENNNPSSLRCHRCDVLNVACSFEADGPRRRPSPPFRSDMVRLQRANVVGGRHGDAQGRHDRNRLLHPETLIRRQGVGTPQIMKQNNLVPTPYLGLFKDPTEFNDWTAAPMLSMQDLVRPSICEQAPSQSEIDVLLDHIMTREQRNYLLDIFEARYSPWLNIPPHMDASVPIVTLARCLVASRHLDAAHIALITPQLVKLTDNLLPKLMFLPVPSTECVQALLILSLWSPSGAPEITADYDERLRAAAAVSLATNLGLHRGSTYVNVLREKESRSQENSNSPQTTGAASSPELKEAKNKTRLWIALSNVESMLCLGTNRAPISRRTDDDLHAIETSSYNAQSSVQRDVRLSIMSQLFDITEHCGQIRMMSSKDVEYWYKDVSTSLMQLEGLYRKISPLAVVTENEQFYNHMLLIYYHACRLNALSISLRTARLTIEAEGGEQPYWEVLKADGVALAPLIAQDIARGAEGILEVALARDDDNLLGTAPDNVFSMIAFGAAVLVAMNFALLRTSGQILNTPTEALLKKIIERLNRVKCTEDHAPVRTARLIAALLAKWEHRFSGELDGISASTAHNARLIDIRDIPTHATRRRVDDPLLASDGGNSGNGNGHAGSAGAADGCGAMVSASAAPAFDLQHLDSIANANELNMLNTDVFMDQDFWSTFMDNVYDVNGMPGVLNGAGADAVTHM